MNRGSSSRGARGAGTNSRGSSFRGRGRGAARGGSSSKFTDSMDLDHGGAYVPEVQQLDQQGLDAEYAFKQRGGMRKPFYDYDCRDRSPKKSRSNYYTGSAPEPQTTNSFDADRAANAARREQRGNSGRGNTSIRGAPESRGVFRSKSVRFQSPPKQQDAPQPQKPNFGQQQKFGPIPGQNQKPFVIPKKAGSQHPKSKLSQSFTPSSSDDDEHIVKIKNTLQHNGLLNDPDWPMAQPGDPRQNSAVKDFWMQMKQHRHKVRQILMKAGLIDDPDKPKKLSEAIDFKGTCEEMCPRFEQIARIMEHDVKNLERAQGPDGTMWPVPQKMIKAYGRSSAGQDAPLPDDIRTPRALRRTLDYMIREIVGDGNNLPTVHNFLWDRTRSIRRDFTFQQASLAAADYADEIYCLETIARFHVIALHQMSDPTNTSTDFSEHQEVEQLGRTLLSLIHTYEDCKALGIVCPNEAEFRAYHLVYHARNPAMMESVQDWGAEFWSNNIIQTAIGLVECLHTIWEVNGPLKPHMKSEIAQNFCNRFFTVLQQPEISYVMACFAELHFNSIRQATLKTILSAYRKQRDQTTDWSASALNSYLHFDSLDDVESFVEAHGLNITDRDGMSYLDFDTAKAPVEPETKVKQPHSKKIVERKRGQKTLPECIYHNAYIPEGAGMEEEESLFVEQPSQQEVPFGFRQSAPEAPVQKPFAANIFRPQTSAAPAAAPQSNPFGSNMFGPQPSASDMFKSQPSGAPPTFSSNGPASIAPKKAFGAFLDSEEDMPAKPAATSQFNFGPPAQAAAAPLFPATGKPAAGFNSENTTPPFTPTIIPTSTFASQQPNTASTDSSGQAPTEDSTIAAQSNPFGASKLVSPPKSATKPAKPFSGFNFEPRATTASPNLGVQGQQAGAVSSQEWKPAEPPKFQFPPAAPKAASPSPAPPAQIQSSFSPSTSSSAPAASEEQPQSASSLFTGFKPQPAPAATEFSSMLGSKATDAGSSEAAKPQSSAPQSSPAPAQPARPAPLGSLGGYVVTSPATTAAAEVSAPKPTFNWLAPSATAKKANTPAPTAQTTAPAPIAQQNSSAPASKKAAVPVSWARSILMEDGGILAQFVEKEIKKACEAACEDRQKELEAEMEKEGEETRKAMRKARRFRKNFIKQKYFYLWQDNARKLATLRRGRETRVLRQRMAEEMRVKKAEEAKKSCDVVMDFSRSVQAGQTNKRKLREEEGMLRASGILNGTHNPSLAASKIVHGDMGPPRSTTPVGSSARGRFARSTSSFNQSTASLQSLVDGDHIPKTNGLCRSLSETRNHKRSQSTELGLSTSRSSSRLGMGKSTFGAMAKAMKTNNVETDYFRLKARGIQTLANGMPVANLAALDLSKFTRQEEQEEPERPQSRSSSTPQLKRSFGSSMRSTPDTSLKRQISGLGLNGPAKRARATPTPSQKSATWEEIEEIKARAKRIMAENAYSKQQDEYELSRSTLGNDQDEAEREAKMQELFRRSAKVREELASDTEWMRSQRQSMSRSMSRQPEEDGARRMQPLSALAPMNLPPPPATGPMSFGTPAKTPAKPPPAPKPAQQGPPQPKLQEAPIEIVDLSD